MTPGISERAFEEVIECALLQYEPDAEVETYDNGPEDWEDEETLEEEAS